MESNRGDERCGRHTHTEGKTHAERAAARHAPYAAHHARHTLQYTATGTHTHTALPQHQHTDGGGRSKQERHTRLHRMHIRRERSAVPAPLTEGKHTHKRSCSAHSNKSKVTIKKGRDPRTPHELLVHGKRSQYSSQKQFSCLLVFLHIQRTTLHAGTATIAAAAVFMTIRSKRWDILWKTAVLLSLAAVVAVPLLFLVTGVVVNSSGCLTGSDVGGQLAP
ncbi:hypothetical protein MOQ_002160 [Trypanosoma cruzi marinkellei]|uniref:Uncharacterized protein n=1 Tax=Trypanosoma cruzi marinkellei TaxID=85056 RepID=K2NEH3_TRYCR|nr:hypothetical protein MOQ_002160 [Trypanosoma cruzi marinkellei]